MSPPPPHCPGTHVSEGVRTPPAEQNVAFLLGLPRSGTTLTLVLIGKYPEVLTKSEPCLMLGLEWLGTTHTAHPGDAALLRLATGDSLAAAAPATYGDFLAQERKSWSVGKTPCFEELPTHSQRKIGRAFARLSLDPPVREARFGRLNGGGRFGDRTILKTTAVRARSIGSYRRTLSPEQLPIIVGGLGRRSIDELGYSGTFDEIAGLEPVIDRSAGLRGLAYNLAEGRRRASAEGRLKAHGSAAGKEAAADVRPGAEPETLQRHAVRFVADNRSLVGAGSVVKTDRAARGTVGNDLQLRLAAAERDWAARLSLIGTLNLQAAQLGDDLEQRQRERAERLALIEQLNGARSGLEVLLADERAQAKRQSTLRAARGKPVHAFDHARQERDEVIIALQGALAQGRRERRADQAASEAQIAELESACAN